MKPSPETRSQLCLVFSRWQAYFLIHNIHQPGLHSIDLGTPSPTRIVTVPP